LPARNKAYCMNKPDSKPYVYSPLKFVSLLIFAFFEKPHGNAIQHGGIFVI